MKQNVVIFGKSRFIEEIAGIISSKGEFLITRLDDSLESAIAETVTKKSDSLIFEGDTGDVRLVERFFDISEAEPALFAVIADDDELSVLKSYLDKKCTFLGMSADPNETARLIMTNLMVRKAIKEENDRRELNAYVAKVLIKGSIRPSYYGFRPLRDAIVYYIENRDRPAALGKCVYAELAKNSGTTAVAIERNIRTTIERCWNESAENFCYNFFGCPATFFRSKPTAKEFISTLAEQIALELEESGLIILR